MLQTKLAIIYTILLALSLSLKIGHAEEIDEVTIVAHIVKYEGIVYVHRESEARSRQVTQPAVAVRMNDMIRTKRNSRAFFKLEDGSKIVLEEKSSIHFRGIQTIGSKQGMVLFDINKRGKLRGLKITNDMTVIGVKGTRFLINSIDDKFNVYMKKGLISIDTITGEFKRFKQRQLNEFEDFKQKSGEEFNEFKTELEKDFVEYVKSFELAEEKAIIIVGDEVRNIAIPPEIEDKFLLFEQF